MADIKFPDFAGESGCTRSGDIISLTGTAISNHVTFASAEADSAIDFDNGDTLYIDVIDGSGNVATWSATYDTTGDGTLTRTATIAGTAVGSLDTTGIQVTSSVPGPWFRTGERISYVTESVTTGNVTVGVNRVHSLTIAGLTANRNFTVPSGSQGDWIGIHIDDGDATYAIVIIGDTGVDVGGSGAATEWSRLLIAGEYVVLRCRAANDWFIEHDGRIPTYCKIDGFGGTDFDCTDGVWETLGGTGGSPAGPFANAASDDFSMADTANGRINLRRDGRYLCIASTTLETATGIGRLKIRSSGTDNLAVGPKVYTSSNQAGPIATGVIDLTVATDVYLYLECLQDTATAEIYSQASTGTFLQAYELL